MTSQEITIAFELAIGVFAVYLLIRRLRRLGAGESPPAFYVEEPRPDPSRGPDELVTIAWFRRTDEAEMWAENLRQAGIEAAVVGGVRSTPTLTVRSEDVKRAIEILREIQ